MHLLGGITVHLLTCHLDMVRRDFDVLCDVYSYGVTVLLHIDAHLQVHLSPGLMLHLAKVAHCHTRLFVDDNHMAR